MYANLFFSVENAVATITVDRPKALNALNLDTCMELFDAFQQCDQRDDVRAAVVTGGGKCFCAGGDAQMYKDMLDADVSHWQAYENVLLTGKMVAAARRCKKPLVAMVNGACFGTGMSLALCCDFRVIGPNTKMSTVFVNAGFSGDAGLAFLLERMLGFARMSELMMSGRPLGAEEILALGLATKLVPQEELKAEAYKMAQSYASGPTYTYGQQKMLFWDCFFNDYSAFTESEALHMANCGQSEDFREAVTALLEKRRPEFKGK